MGIAVWRVTIKPKNRSIFGHVGFRPEKNVCLPTQLGACSHPTGRSTVPYWCTIDVRTPWARHGVPTGPPGPRRAPTAARRPAGGSVRLIFIGGPRFGRPATPILASAGAIVIAPSSGEGESLNILAARVPTGRLGPPGLSNGPGGRRGPTGPRRARGDAVACPGGPNINRAPIRDSRATCRMTTCSELR